MYTIFNISEFQLKYQCVFGKDSLNVVTMLQKGGMGNNYKTSQNKIQSENLHYDKHMLYRKKGADADVQVVLQAIQK